MKTRKDKDGVYFGLRKAHAPYCYQSRFEEIDYLDKLTDKEKEWLARFNEMYVHGRRYKDRRAPYMAKAVRREIWVENAACRRDIYSQMPRRRDAIRYKPGKDLVDEMAHNGLEKDLDSFENVAITCPRCADYEIEFFESREYHGVYFGMCKSCAQIGREEMDLLMPKRNKVNRPPANFEARKALAAKKKRTRKKK